MATLFFYWRFDSAYLTALFVLLCLFLTILGLYWRSILLVRISYATLGLCIIRLLFFDLRETDLLTRALMFIAIGVMMILAQVVYKKFRHRLS